jgi:hypothetical protein
MPPHDQSSSTGGAGRVAAPKLAYQELIDDHDRIDQLTRQLEQLTGSPDDRFAEADRLLAQLSAAIVAHLEKEDSFIYPDLARSTDPADASGLIIEFEILKKDWTDFLAVWARPDRPADWSAFRHDASGMLERLRERVIKETSLLYAMALREGLIQLRPSPRDADGR